jgi:hypothetical protein
MSKNNMSYTVKHLEVELLSLEVRKDSERLNELLSNEFFEFAQSWVAYTKEDIINILPKCPDENISISNYTEKQLTDKLILVHYVANREVISSGKRYCTLCSSIWENSWISNWQMIFFQWTPAEIL